MEQIAGLAFTAINDGAALSVSFETAELAKRDMSGVAEIVIPATFGGLPVTEIADGAFMRCRALKSVAIPDGVAKIGNRAFSMCGLESATIPESVVAFGSSAFSGCADLAGVNLPRNLKRVESNMFEKCPALKSIEIPSGVTLIHDGAFSGCVGLAAITIPESVTIIGNGAFSGAGLESIAVAVGNPKFKSEGNCLLGISGEVLKAGCKTSVIPAGVKLIGRGAFFNCAGLRELAIPEGVAQIDAYAFYDCVNLASVVIPDSVEYVDEEAFYGWKRTQVIQVSEERSLKWKKSWKKGCKAQVLYR
ncbi:MAG: leucine-rich repeat domain-containing protein [Treponema sp.]|nr:leucine-rich repeat domain-containing protein [Treponema sp.]